MKLCTSCCKEIESNASVCNYCQRDQSKYFGIFNRASGIFTAFALLATFIGTILAIQSSIAAKSERRIAEVALSDIKTIEQKVLLTEESIKNIKSDLYRAIGVTYQSSYLGIEHIWTSVKLECDTANFNNKYDCGFRASFFLNSLESVLSSFIKINDQMAENSDLDRDTILSELCEYPILIRDLLTSRRNTVAAELLFNIDNYVLFISGKCGGLNLNDE